jgi:hypothetical protein
MHPNVCRKETSGFLPCQASNGVIVSKLYVGERLRVKTAVLTASPQNAAGIFFALSMHRAIPTPFCSSEYDAVR